MTLAELKSNARVDISADDAELTRLGKEAREDLEDATGRAFVTQTWVTTLNRFPVAGCGVNREIELRVCPVASVTSIVYLAPDGTPTTLATSVYDVDTKHEPALITLKNGQTWPVTLVQARAVTITFIAGYGAAADVPNKIKRAIKMRATHWYNYRGIATDAKAAAGERAYEALKQSICWGAYP